MEKLPTNYGELLYDDEGLPICHICGLSFHRLGSHVRLKHDMTARDYKLQFGLLRSKGLISKVSADIARERAYDNYQRSIMSNLIVKGVGTRYEKGHEGRVAEMVGEQCRRMLQKHAMGTMTKTQREKLGKALGESGKGNEKRWGKVKP